MRLKYFKGCHCLQELKKEYRNLLKKHHPDNDGDLTTMQEINERIAELEKEYAAI